MAAITALCVAGAVTVFSILAFLQIRESAYQPLNDRIFGYLDQAEAGVGNDSEQCEPIPGSREVVQVTFRQRNQPYDYIDRDQRTCIPNLTTVPQNPLPLPRQEDVAESLRFTNSEVSEPDDRMLIARREIDRGEILYMAIAATPVGDAEATISRTRWRLLIGAFLATAIAVAVALAAARRGLRSLGEVQRAAEYVADSEDLGVRLVQQGPAEVRGLASSMNLMLERIQDSSNHLNTALEEQRRFAQDASHELRTPLTAIRGHIELMQRYELPDAERATVVDEMADATDRMKRMVEGLLALARTEGRANVTDQVLLNDVLAEVAASKDEGPHIDGDAGMRVTGDHEQIRGVFTNLAENGRRYGKSVEIFARREGDWAVVEVQDDGPGIAPEDRERIFDRFYRAPGLRSTPGSGLGLAIARQAVTRMGGTINLVDSDHGARFQVRLPLSTEEERDAPPPGVLPVGAYEDDDDAIDPPPGVAQAGPEPRPS